MEPGGAVANIIPERFAGQKRIAWRRRSIDMAGEEIMEDVPGLLQVERLFERAKASQSCFSSRLNRLAFVCQRQIGCK